MTETVTIQGFLSRTKNATWMFWREQVSIKFKRSDNVRDIFLNPLLKKCEGHLAEGTYLPQFTHGVNAGELGQCQHLASQINKVDPLEALFEQQKLT